MSATVYTPQGYEARLRAYYRDEGEEVRAVRVGEKEVSELAAIVTRYADLFTRAQLEALREAEESAEGDAREHLYRLRLTCERGLVEAVTAEEQDALENALLEARVAFDREDLPLRSADARLAVLPGFVQREELGEQVQGRDASFNRQRRELLAAREDLEVELSREPNAVARYGAQKQISLPELEGCGAPRGGRRRCGARAPRRALARAAARPRAQRAADERPSPLAPSPFAARVRHPARPRGPPAEEPARVRDRMRRPRDRPPRHPCAGPPLRHGRGLLLGRLSSRLDPLGPAARSSARRGGRGLVAEHRDGRAPARASSRRARGPRARTLRDGSASTRSTPVRSCPS